MAVGRFRVVSEVRGPEVVEGSEVADVVRQELALDGEPPLGVERTVPAGGPTRAPVVLIHGFAQNRFTWRISRRSFSGWLASQGHEVLNVELRGHGRSRELGAPNARAFSDYAEDVVRVVDHLGAPPFVVGHSLGAAVAIGAALQRPLAGVVHLAGVWTFARHNATLRALARASLLAEPWLLRARVRTAWAGELLAKLYAITDIAGYGSPVAGWVPDSIERDLLEERLSLGFDWTSVEVWMQMARWAAEREPFAWAEPFAALDRPLLVVAGDHDPLVRPADAEACFRASRSTDKELLVFDAFDHEVHWGHLDLVLGRHARRLVWPRIGSWLAARS